MNKVVGCEIELKNGDICGIPAIGRCATCGRAFCMTHQGYFTNNFGQSVPFIDMCVSCAAEKRDNERKRQEEEYAPIAYFQRGTAVTTLRNSGVQTVKIYAVARIMKPSFFGSREVKYPKLYGRGWILGKFPWTISVEVPYGGSERVREDWLTVLMDAYPPNGVLTNYGLIRVRPYSDGYEHVSSSLDRLADADGMKLAGQAVRRLAGVTS